MHGRDTVGVSRAPDDAFLGYASGADSLQIHAADVRRRGETRELFIRGAVTVYDGFAVFNEPLRVTIQNRTLEVQPNQAGVAERAEGSLRVLNANEFGVVRGGIVEFELALREDSAGGSAAVGAAAGTLMISIDVAKGHHVARHAIAPLAAAR